MSDSLDVFAAFHRPAQYIGREWNIVQKDFDAAAVRVALCFPDLYEVGMSNLGLRILYAQVNAQEDALCERVFVPENDYSQALAAAGRSLSSLESRRPLKDFDLLGFSLGYELCYTNVLLALELAGIPLLSAERGAGDPLVIAGGPCCLNPEPMHAFIDAFVIGEGEEVIREICAVLRRTPGGGFKATAAGRRVALEQLAAIPGVYVPLLAPQRVVKRFVADLDTAPFPTDWMVPYIQIVHDRISVETSRGCPNRCRFCQARCLYYPLRHRSPEKVISLCRQAYAASGYEEIALSGLSVSDYPDLPRVMNELIALFKPKGVGISLPSVKPKTFLGCLSGIIATIKKTGLTFAPEAGSQRMRLRLGKDFDEAEFFEVIRQAYAAGYQHVKLYFMTGAPKEEQSDLDAIIDFSRRVSALRKEVCNKYAQVNISVNTLIPKPHTALQWAGMEPTEVSRQKGAYLREKSRRYRFNLSFHAQEMSFLEAVFSRGDRRLSEVILRAFRSGCRFDAWQEHLRFDLWQQAFVSCGIDPQDYLRERGVDEPLAWDFIDTGVSKELFAREWQAVLND